MKIFKTKYVGETTGPNSREGDLGEALSILPSNPQEMVKFTPIAGKMEPVDAALLENADQKYAYTLAMGIQEGYDYLLKIYGKNPPLPAKTHNARLMNDQSHYMRLYIQSPSPSEELIRLVEISLNWYLPMFFLIKKESHFVNAAKHFFQAIVLNREYFTTDEQELVEECFRRNSFMGHPEAILLAGICDPDVKIRKFSAETIIEARQRDSGDIRHFYPPNKLLNFEAKTYMEMVDLRLKSYVTAPPVLRNYDDETLYNLAIEGKIEVPNVPSHSVNNERAIKDTSQASLVAIGMEETHGQILNLGQNRSKICTRHSKKNFVK